MSDLFTLMRKTQEAQAVRMGVEIERQFTDDELASSMKLLADAERELYGEMSADERLGKLGAEEQRLLDELNRKLIQFRVTVTTAAGVKRIDVLATDACMANMRAAEIMFPGFDCDKPMAFKIKVEPINAMQLKEAA